MEKEDLHILRLMGEIERDGSSSQRELSRRLNLSLGLVNTFLKRLVGKGYFKVKTMPRQRVRYFFTPKVLARKSRLTVEYLQYSMDFYKGIKKLLLEKYRQLEDREKRSIVFFGSGEVADLAYLYLQLTRMRLVGIVDDDQKGKKFFDLKIQGHDQLNREDWDVILLTRLDDTEKDIQYLTGQGISPDRIVTL